MAAHGKNLNLEMVKSGFVEVYRGDPVSGQDLAPYWKAEEQARAGKRGMWAQGDKHLSAREWRKMQRG
jgi:endonuclease YncB( thermonuclease family)